MQARRKRTIRAHHLVHCRTNRELEAQESRATEKHLETRSLGLRPLYTKLKPQADRLEAAAAVCLLQHLVREGPFSNPPRGDRREPVNVGPARELGFAEVLEGDQSCVDRARHSPKNVHLNGRGVQKRGVVKSSTSQGSPLPTGSVRASG